MQQVADQLSEEEEEDNFCSTLKEKERRERERDEKRM